MNKKFNKIFVVGYNKTATCSIDALFNGNGLNSFHGGGLNEGDWKIDKYDAFSDQHPDGTDFFRFRKCHQDYPDSLFILNTRKLKDWILSRCGHAIFTNAFVIEKDGSVEWSRTWGYPDVSSVIGRENRFSFKDLSDEILDLYYEFIKDRIKFWIIERESYYASILYFFKGYPEDLVLINIHNEWKSFLGDMVFEEYEITGSRMKASEREYSSEDQKKFFDAHKEVYVQATKDVLSSYPKFIEESLLLHDAQLNKHFLSIYKNNF